MLKKIFTYIASNFIEAAITFLLLPILTSKLNKEEYGLMVLFMIFSKFLIPIINLNLNSSASVEYFKRDEIQFSSYLKTIMVIPLINLFIITSILSILLFYQIFPSVSSTFILFIPLFVLSQFLPNLYTSICQSKNESFKFGFFKNLNAIINFIFVLVILYGTNLRVEAQIIGFFIGNTLLSFVTFFLIFKRDFFKFKRINNDLNFAYNFGFTILFHSISGVIISMSDRFILEQYKGLNEVGIYSVGYQIGTIITIIATGISRSLVPTIYENLKLDTVESKIKIVKHIYFLKLTLFVIGILMYLGSDLFFYFLVDEKFSSAKNLILPLILGLIFQGFYMFIASIFFYHKKNGLLSSLTFCSAILNISLNYLFIPLFGSMGAAYATFITYFIFWIISWVISNRVKQLNWLYFLK